MAEKDHLIMTATGPDKVGLVEQLSKFISQRGCNIEDSKMAVFCGEFAVIILISGDAGALPRISRDYPQLQTETGLAVTLKPASAREPAEFFLPYKLTASCMDHPGIVYEISGVLRSLGINIESMETKTYVAPVSGTPLFQLNASLSVPARTNINQVRERFGTIQREQNIDIELTPIKA
jgi:glycine cleavage system transcriptional repressor